MIAGIQKSTTGGPLMRQGLPLCLINPLACQECGGYCVCVCQSGKMHERRASFSTAFSILHGACLGHNRSPKKGLVIQEKLRHFGDIFLMFWIFTDTSDTIPTDHLSSGSLRGGFKNKSVR